MPWNGNVMTTPIGMGDISQAVNNTSLDLGTLVGKGNIKKWALHKPVRLLDGVDTPADLYPDNTTWVTHMNNDVREIASNTQCPFALKVTPSNNLYKIVGLTADASVDWVYQQPPIEGTFWRRMLDFKGYTNTPNVPMNEMPSVFNFYADSTNTITIDTNDKEASDTSIQVSQLTGTLGNYNLMLAVNGKDGYWYLVVMNATISSSVDDAGTISFTLPTTGFTPGSGTYDAYVVGLSKDATISKNTWVPQSNNAVQNFSWNMIPLPFESKEKCHFTFKFESVAPTSTITITYTFYIKRNTNIIQKIVFDAEKYKSTTDLDQLSVSLTNIVVHDDYETESWNINNTVIINGFVYNSTTQKITASKELNVSTYDINAGDYPNLTYTHSVNKSGLTTADGGTNGVIWVD